MVNTENLQQNQPLGGSKQTTLCYEKFSHASQDKSEQINSQNFEKFSHEDDNENEVDKTRDKTFENGICNETISVFNSPEEGFHNLDSAIAGLKAAGE